jgi:hypothetical protein
LYVLFSYSFPRTSSNPSYSGPNSYEIEAGADSPQAIGFGIVAESPFRSTMWGTREAIWLDASAIPREWTKTFGNKPNSEEATDEFTSAAPEKADVLLEEEQGSAELESEREVTLGL